MLVLSAMGPRAGTTRSPGMPAMPRMSPTMPGGAAGRTFPSAAGFHTAELFFTDDSGLWFFPTRDAGALVDPATEQMTPELMVERHRADARAGRRPRLDRAPAAGPGRCRADPRRPVRGPGEEAHQPFQEVPEEWNARVDAFWREVEARA
jgi:hypothetical protein